MVAVLHMEALVEVVLDSQHKIQPKSKKSSLPPLTTHIAQSGWWRWVDHSFVRVELEGGHGGLHGENHCAGD